MRLLLIAMPHLLSGCWATKPGGIVNGFPWVLYFCLNAAPRLMELTGGAASAAPGTPEPDASMPRNRCYSTVVWGKGAPDERIKALEL